MDGASSDPNAASFDCVTDDVFSRIASRYDVLCDLFSLGIHRIWKSRMARRIAAEPWDDMLDVAAGTGDIALRVIRNLGGATTRSCVVSDICPAMLEIAKRRAGPLAGALQFRVFDAHRLAEIASASVDLHSMSFGMKICDRKRAVAKAWRVLRPGGRFMCLEASEIPVRFIRRLYLAYMSFCMPVVGWVATGGDASAYHYLLSGVRAFPGARQFADEISAQGFVEVGYEQLSFGIVAIHTARKPR
ncbi:ubiquinone/menaquinone biosynthesis methyltransferase [Bradyrhizobium sp.]|uniref:ubiquinone/menaquinone biosynthesis methyltransferase n=1 Tax=Bradyrhizobium sp. TaxID=376 RepID=UPI002C5DDDEE|nr:ubiquinone/menaquinone biosynthesis methyltransferase [Bradyrhizobium sp.]HWX59665.1 ubiquinone/menaquinone biosynthesis methyltransferase [Bradyrhizobium sp.]